MNSNNSLSGRQIQREKLLDLHVGESNTLATIGLLILLAIGINYFTFHYLGNKYTLSSVEIIYVAESCQTLLEKEIAMYGREKLQKEGVKLQFLPGNLAISQFGQQISSLLIVDRKLSQVELDRLSTNHPAVQQQLLATGSVGAPVKSLYFLRDNSDIVARHPFEKFLFGKKGQAVLFHEGYIPARMEF